MTKEERKKAIDALKISAPIMAMTQEEFNDYIQTLNRIMDWLEQEPKIEKVIKMRDATPEERESIDKYIKSISKPTGVSFWDLEQEPKTGHWKLVQRGKSIDICCSNCEKVRIKQYAYNYTIDQLDKEDLEECFECADMRYCPNCGAKMESEGE